jgi:type IV pilus assembly protein PilY1
MLAGFSLQKRNAIMFLNCQRPDTRSMIMKTIGKVFIPLFLILSLLFLVSPVQLNAATMSDYCVVPPFAAQSVPPLVMLIMSKDHKLFYKAYTDVVDLDDPPDGTIEATYTDRINYYGYFDSNKCYTYDSANSRFNPAASATGTNKHFCTGRWSGNFLNWATMARIDILRKVLYGGKRVVDDTTGVVLARTKLPRDAHSWAKAYKGDATNGLVSQLTPYAYTSITLCNTDTSTTAAENPYKGSLIMAKEGFWPYAASLDAGGAGQCTKRDQNDTYSLSDTTTGAYTELRARVAACVSGMLESNCQVYYQGASTKYYRPSGLMEKYGMNRKGTDDTSDDAPQMYFGLITGSYDKNLDGGVLRSNITDVSQEINSLDGTIKFPSKSSPNNTSKIISNLDKLEIVKYDYTNNTYANGGCGLISSFADGTCENWGNPIGEMFYEGLRYFMGKKAYTSTFYIDESNSGDAGIKALGITSESKWCNPYAAPASGDPANCAQYPVCSKPFMLVLSDTYPSFDSDQLPGSNWPAALSTNDTPSVKTLIANSNINALEGFNNVFIGQSGAISDQKCSSKPSDFANMRGLCAAEPLNQGSFYVAGLAHWAHTVGFENPVGKKHTVSTYVVATPSTLPNLQFNIGSNQVELQPTFWVWTGSNAGARGQLADFQICQNDADWTAEKNNGFQFCYDIMWDDSAAGNDYDLDIRYRIYVQKEPQGANAYSDTSLNTITVKTKGLYASAGNTDTAGYIITGVNNSGEYLEIACGGNAGGSDCDRYCNASYDAQNNCTGTDTTKKYKYNVSNNNVRVCNAATWVNCTANADCSAVISGDTCNATSSQTMSDSTIERVFNVTGASADFVQNPLYYAAKYGGFDDKDNSGTPNDPKEWLDTTRNLPKTYFYASNPIKLEQQLESAFLGILRQASSGTAVSVLASGEGSGANILQAFFYPLKDFIEPPSGQTEISWIGEMQNLWYYLDPRLQNSSIREDTTRDNILNLNNDNIIQFYFDTVDNKTKANKYDNSGAYQGTVEIDEVKNLWEAGKKLWYRDYSTRTLYTSSPGCPLLPGQNMSDFASNATCLQSYLQASSLAEAQNIVKYVRGKDFTFCSNDPSKPCTTNADCTSGGTCTQYRNRSVKVTTVDNIAREWKLSDIISSTPKVQSWLRLNTYDSDPPFGYSDTSYGNFIGSNQYKKRGMVYVGANDGMFHAFNFGLYGIIDDPTTVSQLCLDVNNNGQCDSGEASSGTPFTSQLGQEQWTYIPFDALPYLKYLGDPNYCHLYYVDQTPYLFDASINVPTGCSAANYWDCDRKDGVDQSSKDLDLAKSSWRTILIGGMGLGGACKDVSASCTDCVKTPMSNAGFSSYFALDVSDPQKPVLLWEFSDRNIPLSDRGLGFSTSGPAIVRVGDKTKNGKWFAIFASGPTGPIDSTQHQFMGKSDQNLKLFILDLKTGTLVRTITMDGTGGTPNITKAFGGSLVNASVDTDRAFPGRSGSYQDDVFYVGYAAASGVSGWSGGVLRVTTKEDLDPSHWVVSKLISGIGPVTSGISHLLDKQRKKLWLFLGTGRYFYKLTGSLDDLDGQRSLFGIKDPCYLPSNTFDNTCTTEVSTTRGSSITDSTTSPPSTDVTNNGWVIDLDMCTDATGNVVACTASTVVYAAERDITTPLAAFTGNVFFTSTSPSSDPCAFGGTTHLWAVNFTTGGVPKAGTLKGKALVQVSTGTIQEINLATAFTEKGSRRTVGFFGMPPKGQGLSVVINPRAIKKILHIQER